jgi:hypothetical protein
MKLNTDNKYHMHSKSRNLLLENKWEEAEVIIIKSRESIRNINDLLFNKPKIRMLYDIPIDNTK